MIDHFDLLFSYFDVISVVLLSTLCYGLDEKDIPEHLRKNFDGNKLILPVTREYGQEFYANMTMKAFTAVLRSMARERWRSLAKELVQYRNHHEKRNRLSSMLSSGANVQPMLRNDKDMSGDSLKDNDGRIRQLNGLLAQGVKLMAAATGNAVGNKTVRLLSPRIGNTNQAANEISLLSPEMSLSTDPDNGDPERNALLELLLEVSGATAGMRKALNRMKSEISQMTKDDVEKTIGRRERQKIEVIEMMERTYSSEQLDSFKKTGFAFMTAYQRRLIYGETSPYKNEGFLRRTRGLRKDQLERKLINTIRLQAIGKSDYNRRMKIDLINAPTVDAVFMNAPLVNVNSVFSPVVLSAFVSSPTLMGPLILSPWLFSALITSPWALCPIILSPFAFVPIILSPVALSPFVLSPGIFSPAILSPLLMVPYILSPGVFNPIILSPLLLTPMVLSPLTASPVILSPALLSPLVLSPMYHTAFVLSPSLLSPPIASDGEGVSIVLSPDLGML
ncbi:hypothetical protein TELCIR_10322 [Teladorsagia circumcincta]|uniref:Uncharacterized protein n=1 Tax=Teladorsagia circumcincta TaxID=45464 RepID=A0A2G9UCE9_TELCI|nr:hypothetical protein TELCIR_10322 [Teladorsagia circumcincta]